MGECWKDNQVMDFPLDLATKAKENPRDNPNYIYCYALPRLSQRDCFLFKSLEPPSNITYLYLGKVLTPHLDTVWMNNKNT